MIIKLDCGCVCSGDGSGPLFVLSPCGKYPAGDGHKTKDIIEETRHWATSNDIIKRKKNLKRTKDRQLARLEKVRCKMDFQQKLELWASEQVCSCGVKMQAGWTVPRQVNGEKMVWESLAHAYCEQCSRGYQQSLTQEV